MDRDGARAQILLSGSGDFVSLAEAAQYVRDDLPKASVELIKAESLKAIRYLLDHGYVQIGELCDRFVPWDPRTAMSELDSRWTTPSQDLAPWDGIWLANTPAGDRLADDLADDGRVTKS